MDKLLDQLAALAAKLNVAADVLYAALLRQAIIAGVTDLLIYAGIAYAGYWMLRWSRWCKEQRDEIVWLPFGLVALVYVILVVTAAISLQNTVAAFVNPEYWALNRLLRL